MPEEVPGCADVHAVDTELFGTPGFMSAYVIDAERPAVVDPGAASGVERVRSALVLVGVGLDGDEGGAVARRRHCEPVGQRSQVVECVGR
ncbi:hypothetical protein BRD00_13775 [Halobacteriales archaeon QS_8_69_26]|nr:MAG: hypothetical protein BRD00_13775 [Halobacteriales archaeon QS_8_69_26]